MALGRPPTYETPEQLQDAIDEYFALIKAESKIGTVPGLALHLGFATKQSIYDLRDKVMGGALSYPIKRALMQLEDGRLQQGIPAVAVMDLKNNFDYTDRRDHNVTGTLTIQRVCFDDDQDTQ